MIIAEEGCEWCGGSGRHEGKFVMFGAWPDCAHCRGTGAVSNLEPSPPEERAKLLRVLTVASFALSVHR